MLNIFLFMNNFFSLFTQQSEPVRLAKKEENNLESFCRRICPYILLGCVIILVILVFVALVRYGFMFSTEAHQYEHLQQITVGG